MLSHVESRPVTCVVASISGLLGGATNFLHLANEFLALLSALGGALLSVVTILGLIKSWAKERAMRELIASPTPPPLTKKNEPQIGTDFHR